MRTRNLIALFFGIDVFILSVIIFFVSHLHYGAEKGVYDSVWNLWWLFVIGWFVTTLIFIDDVRNLKLGLTKVFNTQLKKFVVFISLVAVVIISFKLDDFSRSVFFGTVSLFVAAKMLISLWFFYYWSVKDNTNYRDCIIIGNTKIGRELFRYYSKYTFIGIRPIGILDDNSIETTANNVIGIINDFDFIYEEQPFLEAIIALPLSEMDHIKKIIASCEKNGVKTHIVPNYYGSVDRIFKINMLGNFPMLDLRAVPLDGYPNRFWKRAFDLAMAVALLIALSPIMLFVAILIKLTSKGPVFYKPIRLGVDNKPFVLYKFRSMSMSEDASHASRSTVINDPRVTPLGRFLRKSNIDELPQLFNVIMNEMSLVGPRPHRVHLNHSLKQKMATYMVRHWVKPGITGWAQVNGWRGPTESRLQYMGRTLHDVWYIEHWNFWLDLYILFLTIYSKKVRKNAF